VDQHAPCAVMNRDPAVEDLSDLVGRAHERSLIRSTRAATVSTRDPCLNASGPEAGFAGREANDGQFHALR
jgi:hypothetical protein